MRIAERPAERAGGILVDIAERAAPAPFGDVGVAAAIRVELAAKVHRDRALAIGERAHRAQVRTARKAHAGDGGVRRLVHDDARQQLGRILVELDGAVVARAGLLAPVEQRGGEVRREAADRDHLGAAVDPLGGEAGQAGDRFGDGDVGQLADVLGRYRFDDRGLVALDVDRILQAGAQAGHDDRALLGRHLVLPGPCGAVLRPGLGWQRCRQSQRRNREPEIALGALHSARMRTLRHCLFPSHSKRPLSTVSVPIGRPVKTGSASNWYHRVARNCQRVTENAYEGARYGAFSRAAERRIRAGRDGDRSYRSPACRCPGRAARSRPGAPPRAPRCGESAGGWW